MWHNEIAMKWIWDGLKLMDGTVILYHDCTAWNVKVRERDECKNKK